MGDSGCGGIERIGGVADGVLIFVDNIVNSSSRGWGVEGSSGALAKRAHQVSSRLV